jgi:hypothetical protein
MEWISRCRRDDNIGNNVDVWFQYYEMVRYGELRTKFGYAHALGYQDFQHQGRHMSIWLVAIGLHFPFSVP